MSEYYRLLNDLEIVNEINKETDFIIAVNGNGEAVRLRAGEIVSDAGVVFDIPTSPSSEGEEGQIAITEDAIYTYSNGEWGSTPRTVDWSTKYLRVDTNAPALSQEERAKLNAFIEFPDATQTASGVVKLAVDPAGSYNTGSFAATPAFVMAYVAEHGGGGGGVAVNITSNYEPGDTVNAITGRGVSKALATLPDIPERATNYVAGDRYKYITGSVLKIAIDELAPVDTYTPGDSTYPISGRGVAAALATIPEATNSYNPFDEVQPITGAGVKAAMDANVSETIKEAISKPGPVKDAVDARVEEILAEYDIDEIIDRKVNASAVELKSELNATISTVRDSIPRLTSDYLPNNSELAVTGSGVSKFLTNEYDPGGSKATTGKAVASALAAFSPVTLINTYDSEDEDNAITGKGVSGILTSDYEESDSTKAITGAGVKQAISQNISEEITNVISSTSMQTIIAGRVEEELSKGTIQSQISALVTAEVSDLDIPVITNSYRDDDYEKAITGYGVSQILTDAYDPDNSTSAVTGKAVASALAAFSPVTLINTYDSEDEDNAITGKGVSGILTNNYSSTNSTLAVTGQAVASALSSLVTSTYSSSDSDLAITGKGVSQILTNNYSAGDGNKAVTGQAVAAAISPVSVVANSASSSVVVLSSSVSTLQTTVASKADRTALNNYYTKSGTSDLIATATAGLAHSEDLDDYVTTFDLDSRGYVSMSQVEAKGYVTKEEGDTYWASSSALSSYVPVSSMTSYLAPYATQSNLNTVSNKFSSCVTIAGAQSISGVKTFTNGIQLRSTSTATDPLITSISKSITSSSTDAELSTAKAVRDYVDAHSGGSSVTIVQDVAANKSSTNVVPSAKATYSYGSSLIVTNLNSSSDNAHAPSVKAVVDYVANHGMDIRTTFSGHTTENDSVPSTKLTYDTITASTSGIAKLSANNTFTGSNTFTNFLTVGGLKFSDTIPEVSGITTSIDRSEGTYLNLLLPTAWAVVDMLPEKATEYIATDTDKYITGAIVSEAINSIAPTGGGFKLITGAADDPLVMVDEKYYRINNTSSNAIYLELDDGSSGKGTKTTKPITSYLYIEGRDTFSVITQGVVNWLYDMNPSLPLGKQDGSQTHVFQFQQVGSGTILGAYLYSYDTPPS